MLKLLSAVGGAALIAGAVAALPGVIENVSASTPQAAGVPEVADVDAAKKGDRLDRVLVMPPADGSCSQQNWPYFDPRCIARPVQPGKPQRPVRIITPDRI